MNRILDNELILYLYRDGLSPERLREIERALGISSELQARYQTLQRILAVADRDLPPQPDAGFETRVWQGLEPRLAESSTKSPPRRRARAAAHRHGRRHRRGVRAGLAGLAAAAVLAIVVYLPIRNEHADPFENTAVVPTQDQALQPSPRQRSTADLALAGFVATHLRNAEAVLLSVINNDDGPLVPMGNDVVQALVGNNRLYAAAAARQGDLALAGFLESLDPILIELANRPSTGEVQQVRVMREFVQTSDLLFKLRAVEARLRTRTDNHA